MRPVLGFSTLSLVPFFGVFRHYYMNSGDTVLRLYGSYFYVHPLFKVFKHNIMYQLIQI